MALGDQFPTELVNTTDLRIDRPAFSADFADDPGTTATVIATNLAAVVVPSRDRFTRGAESEEVAHQSKVILDPSTAPAGIQSKDLVQWTDFYGQVTRAEVIEVERFSGVPGLESIVLRVGKGS